MNICSEILFLFIGIIKIKPVTMEQKDNNLRNSLEDQCKNIIEDCEYGSKKYFNEKDFLDRDRRRINFWFNLFSTGLAGAAGGAAILPYFESHPRIKFIAVGLLSISSAFVSAFRSSLDYDKQINECNDIANNYLSLKKRVIFFSRVKLPSQEPEKLVNEVEAFVGEGTEIDRKNPPLIYQESWVNAKKGVEAGESIYRTDNEKVPKSN